MGYAVWLVPVQAQQLAICEIMAVRPAHSQPTSRCYPRIDPHITIAVFDCDNELDPALFEDLKALATDIPPITTTFSTVNFGKTYLGAAKVLLNQTARLDNLRDRVADVLRGHNLADRSKSFPHLSLFYVNEQAERNRLIKQLVKDKYIVQEPGSDGYALTASNLRDGLLKTFDGSEIWLVDCRGSVANWQRIGAPIPLCKPSSPADRTPGPAQHDQRNIADLQHGVGHGFLGSSHQPHGQNKSRMVGKSRV